MSENNPASPPGPPKRWLVFLLIFGLYLSIRGYQSREGDQAYRLPLLLHRQDPALFANDPFVRAFDTFNPHRGSLALLDVTSRVVGLSAALAVLFALTFAATCFGLDRLARSVWPEAGHRVGTIAVVLVLVARAGNIGTNHLFEPMLLDRLIGFGLGWVALGSVVADPRRGLWIAPLALGMAALVHPSVGLQLAMLLMGGWVGFGIWAGSTGVDRRTVFLALAMLGLSLGPAMLMNAGQGSKLFEGITPAEFRLLSVELQSPQHMLPHLWRFPQWLAWGCYPVLALISLGRIGQVGPRPSWPSARVRFAVLLTINLAGIGLAWSAVEIVRDLRVTVFQPFRMATILRGLALVAISGRLLELWRRGRWIDRSRVVLLIVGLDGDWSMVVVTAYEVVLTALDLARVARAKTSSISPTPPHPPPPDEGGVLSSGSLPPRGGGLGWGAAFVLGLGLAFLARHDTESGHIPLIGALIALTVATWAGRLLTGFAWNRRRMTFALAGAWAVPLAALVAGCGLDGDRPWVRALVDRCRFAAMPTEDIERLAVWCRDHTPPSARFIGPPGPKAFRLWSLRSLAFNRAGSPYHAEGLADWSARFRDHVGFSGTSAAFVRAYLADRHALEHRYQAMSPAELAALATRQDASYIIAAPFPGPGADGPLERLHVEGRYAVYRVPIVVGRVQHAVLPSRSENGVLHTPY